MDSYLYRHSNKLWTTNACDKKANGNAATRRELSETGQYVVIKNVAKEVIQVAPPGLGHGHGSGDLP